MYIQFWEVFAQIHKIFQQRHIFLELRETCVSLKIKCSKQDYSLTLTNTAFLILPLLLQAAHCIQDKRKSKKRTPEDLVVKLGKYDLKVPNERGSLIGFPSEIIVHPKWNTQSSDYDADIAIIVLELKVESSATISPICLWDQTSEPEDLRGHVVGWGKSEFSAAHELRPREIELKIRSNEECFAVSPQFEPISSNETFCAGRDSYSGPCKGDSGSGMFVQHDAKRWFLKGVVSAGFNKEQMCDVSVDVLFTDASKYTEWIKKIAKERNISLPNAIKEETHQQLVKKPRKSDKEIFCFFQSSAEGREGNGAFTISNLNPELCSTLVFMEAEIEGYNLVASEPRRDASDDGKRYYKEFNSLKNSHNLTTLLSVGNSADVSRKILKLAADPVGRQSFARSSVELLKLHKFDGLHLHWDHSDESTSAVNNFILLLEEVSRVYKTENLFLSALVPARAEFVNSEYDLKKISRLVDRMMIKTFDFYGDCHSKIEYPAAITGDSEFTLMSSIDDFLSRGVPAEKILLGIPFHGRIFGSLGDGEIGDVAELGPFGGPYTNENGFVGYNEVCYYENNYVNEVAFDANASQSIMRIGGGGEVIITILYDSPRSIVNKVDFLVRKKLAGSWAFSVDTDDFTSDCEWDDRAFIDFPAIETPQRTEKDFPLLRTMKKAMEVFSPAGKNHAKEHDGNEVDAFA